MAGVVEGAALHVDVGGLLEERHEAFGGAGHPRLGEAPVVEGGDEELEDVAGGTEAGEEVPGRAGDVVGRLLMGGERLHDP